MWTSGRHQRTDLYFKGLSSYLFNNERNWVGERKIVPFQCFLSEVELAKWNFHEYSEVTG